MPKTVLIIDDDPAILRLLQFQLNAFGFEVILSESGLQAIELMKRKQIRLVVTDMRMPVADGYDVISEIRELYPETPIVLTTAHEVNGRVKEALRFESVVLVRKPFTEEEFKQAVQEAVTPSLRTFPSAA